MTCLRIKKVKKEERKKERKKEIKKKNPHIVFFADENFNIFEFVDLKIFAERRRDAVSGRQDVSVGDDRSPTNTLFV